MISPVDAPIAVIDSGLGGLTVARAIHAVLPSERVLYFGDTARLPYGNKSRETVIGFIRQIIQSLLPLQPKHFVLACNTATALALPAIRSIFPGLPISGVIDPGARAAAVAAGSNRAPNIGVIATEATVRSKAYERSILQRRQHARVFIKATPALVPLIEEGRDNRDPLLKLALKQYLLPLMERKIDVLVLGCTHYPLIRPIIRGILGAKIPVIDSAEMCAEDVLSRLQAAGLLRSRIDRDHWLYARVTDDPARFQMLASRFLGEPVPRPEFVSPDELFIATATATAEQWMREAKSA